MSHMASVCLPPDIGALAPLIYHPDLFILAFGGCPMVDSLGQRYPHWVMLARVMLLGIGGLAGCTAGRNTVTGQISPAHFEFTKVVEKSGPENEPGGWWAVCIHARITMGDSGATSICKFEVGMPVRNESEGEISLRDAQEAAAAMANRAMFKILSEADPTVMHVIHCNNFKALYNLMLKEKIGSSVAEVGATGWTEGLR
ncbi:hypothetical protein JQX13_13495 [Archangium violaceum]|uniref:hypothetical protein n=1 Tax=Archangium violaceum TaxID=83451 RepID=UPI00193B04D6|nr:hypothetical protein [Archangium violaceum]QRK10987.1 hypothetical protein JQX13_13495 [Archangium violaceum]